MVDSTGEQPGLFRRLLRGSGSAEKTKIVRYPIHAYGKLPIYKDFISTGLTDAAAREFRNWLDRGFSHRWAVDDDYRDTDIPSHSFLFRLSDGRGCVAGSLWGSSDEGGLRKFPFTLFVSFASGQAAADPLTAVEYLALLDRRSQELRDMFGPGASLTSLYRAYRGAEFECPLRSREQILREGRSAAADLPLSEFAESLLGASSARRWPKILEATAGALGPSSDGLGAIRLPLGGALPRAREVAFWLLWIARQDPKRRRPVCGILYPNGSGPGRVTLFFRDLRAEDILLLHPERGDYPDVLDVLRATAPPERAEPLPAPAAVAEPVSTVPDIPAPAATPISAVPAAASPEVVEPPVSVEQPVAASSEVAPMPVEAAAAATLDAVPFPEAETVHAEPAGPVAVEEPPLDAAGRPRLTRAPFELGAGPSAVAMVDPIASAGLETGSPSPDPGPPPPRPPSAEEPPLPPPAAVIAESVPAAIPSTATPEPAPALPEAPPAPAGWDRPLFALLDA